jgi:indole-3-acetate monooxygenase
MLSNQPFAGFSSQELEHLRAAWTLASDRAAQHESARKLSAELVESLARAGVFRMLMPKDTGGLEVSPRAMVEAIESVAAADGAAGWCVMIGATSGLCAAFLDAPVARTLFTDPLTVAAGVFAPSGRAHKVEGGYSVSGRWSFTSGGGHSAWRLGGAMVVGGDDSDAKPVLTAEGAPQMLHVMLPREHTTLLDTWDVSGLRGTGSHDMVADRVFVPDAHAFSLFGKPKSQGALYTFPFYGLLALGVAGVALGLARSSLQAFREIARSKKPAGSNKTLAEKEGTQERFARAEAAYGSARAYVLASIAEAEQASGPETRARVRLAAVSAVTLCVEAVDTAYAACGMTSVFASSVLQRNFRDIHVITQHFMVNETIYTSAGRALLGLPGAPL